MSLHNLQSIHTILFRYPAPLAIHEAPKINASPQKMKDD